MGNARDFFTSSMADALLPSLRRSFEDVVYETLDERQVPTRTDFKELRDQQNALRGQLAGAAGGVKKLSDDVEGLEDKLGALEARITALESAQSRQADALAEALAARIGQRLDRLEARLAEPWLDARILRAREDAVAALNPRIEARLEKTALEPKLSALRDELAASLEQVNARLDALQRAAEPSPAASPAAPVAPDVQPAPPKVSQEPSSSGDARKLCRVPDCGEIARSKGFCARHYQLWRRGRLDGFPLDEGAA